MLAWLRTFAVGHWMLIALVIALLGYHEYSLLSAVYEAKAAKDVEWTGKIAEANQRAKDDHDAQQAKIDALAASSQPEVAKKFESITALLAQLKAQAKAPPKIFAENCVLPPAEVLSYNAIGAKP